MLTDSELARWVRFNGDGGITTTVEGVLLFGSMAVHQDGRAIRLYSVLVSLGRKALANGCSPDVVRRYQAIYQARRLPAKSRLMHTFRGVAAFITIEELEQEINRVL